MIADAGSHRFSPSGQAGLITAAGLGLGVAITLGLARFAYALILPAMRQDLGWTYTQAGWNNTANAIGYVLGAILAFRLVRTMGPGRVFPASLWITVAALVATGLTSDFFLLALFRLVAGLSGGVSFVAGGALASNIFPRDAGRSSTAIAVYFAVGGAAIALSGLTLPWLFASWGNQTWPYAWWAMGGVSAIATLFAAAASRRVSDPEVGVENRDWVKRPFLPLLVAYGFFGFGYIVYMTFIIAWMQEHGAGAPLIALFWGALGLATVAATPVWRRPLASWGGGKPLAVSMLVVAVGSALPLWQTALPVMLVSALLFGGAFFIAPTAVTVFARRTLAPSQWGQAVAGFTIVFACCQAVGPVLSGAISDAAGSLFAGLAFSSVLLALGGMVALLQRDLPR